MRGIASRGESPSVLMTVLPGEIVAKSGGREWRGDEIGVWPESDQNGGKTIIVLNSHGGGDHNTWFLGKSLASTSGRTTNGTG